MDYIMELFGFAAWNALEGELDEDDEEENYPE